MLTAKLILERLDKEGRVLEKREQLSRSFVKNFIGLLYCAHAQIQEAAPYAMTDIDGTPRTVDDQTSIASRFSKSNLRVSAPPGASGLFCFHGYANSFDILAATIVGEKIGIQVGTGTNAVTPTDVALQTRILHGTQANRLEYGGCELIDIKFANPNGEFTIRRYFTNASGGLITVNEVGIHAIGTDASSDDKDAWAFLIARDLTGGVAVADTEILRVTYVPQITV